MNDEYEDARQYFVSPAPFEAGPARLVHAFHREGAAEEYLREYGDLIDPNEVQGIVVVPYTEMTNYQVKQVISYTLGKVW